MNIAFEKSFDHTAQMLQLKYYTIILGDQGQLS